MADAVIQKNISLWSLVSKTNPKYTKKVKLGREFTAIDPYSQIMKATEVFGPVGKGWGWEVIKVEYTPTDQVAILVRLWHGERTNYFEQWGQAGLYIDKNKTRPDTDLFKKATTDAVTKALSYLGFNADVFLGMFDDNKYVRDTANEFAEAEKEETAEPLTDADTARIKSTIESLEACATLDELKNFIKSDAFKDVVNGFRGKNQHSAVEEITNAYKLAEGRAKENPTANNEENS